MFPRRELSWEILRFSVLFDFLTISTYYYYYFFQLVYVGGRITGILLSSLYFCIKNNKDITYLVCCIVWPNPRLQSNSLWLWVLTILKDRVWNSAERQTVSCHTTNFLTKEQRLFQLAEGTVHPRSCSLINKNLPSPTRNSPLEPYTETRSSTR